MAEAELAEQRLVEAEIEITHVLVHVPVIQLKVAKKEKLYLGYGWHNITSSHIRYAPRGPEFYQTLSK